MDNQRFNFDKYLVYKDLKQGYHYTWSVGAKASAPSWMQSTTRAKKIEDNPTVELQSTFSENEQDYGFVLSNSILSKKYYEVDAETGNLELKNDRGYEYSEYLIREYLRENVAEEAEAACLSLFKKDLFLDLEGFSAFFTAKVEKDYLGELLSLSDLEATLKDIRGKFKIDNKLENEGFALFLASYWRACWLRVKKIIEFPLVLIVTPYEEFNNTNGSTIIPEGVLFFHDYVLPHLPDAVKAIISISFGCNGDADGCSDTACMVCTPEDTAMKQERVYTAAYGLFKEKQGEQEVVNDIDKIAGMHMLNNDMPRAYTRTCKHSGNIGLAEIDYGYFRLVCDYECYLDEIEEKERDDDERRDFILACLTDELGTLREILNDYGFTPSQITDTLYELELRTINDCEKYTKKYDPELYSIVLKNCADLSERNSDLTKEEQRKLKDAYIAFLAKKYPDTQEWRNSPVVHLCSGKMTAGVADAVTKIVDNKQNYNGIIDDTIRDVLDTMLAGQISARVKGNDKAAKAIMNFILEHIDRSSESFFNVCNYITMSGEILEDADASVLLDDVKTLIERHNIFVTKEEPLFDEGDAKRELEFENHLAELLSEEPMKLEATQVRELMKDTRLILPKWCNKDSRTFDIELYEAMLNRAIEEYSVGSWSDSEKQEYSDCVTASYAFEEKDKCRLAVLIKHDCNQYPDEWDEAICKSTTENAVLVPCDAKELVSHIASLRANGRHTTAESYFELLEQTNKYEDEKSPDYASAYLTALDKNRRTVGADREKLEMQANDVGRLLKRVYDAGTKEQNFTPSPACMEQIARWYAMHRAECSREVTEAVENVFTYALSYAAKSHNERVHLVNQYCEIAKLYQNDIEKFWKELLDELGNCDIDELMQGNDAVPAVKEYIRFDSKRAKEITGLLKKAVEKKKEVSGVLSPADAASVIIVSRSLGLDKCIDEIELVLNDSLDGSLSENVLTKLCEYADNCGKDEVQRIKNCLNKRCEHKPEEISRFKDLMRFMESSYRSGTKASFGLEALAHQLKETVENTLIPQCKKPDAELTNLVLKQAIDAKQHLGNITEDMMCWYEAFDIEPEDKYALMSALAQKMGILPKDAATSVWHNFFMRYSCETLCGRIRAEHFSMSNLMDMSDMEESAQIAVQAAIPDNSGMRMDMKKLIVSAIEGAIKDDGNLQNADYLAEQAKRVNEIKPTGGCDLYRTALKDEVYNYLAGVLKDNKSFCALTHDAKSVRDLSKGMSNVNTEDEEVKRRVKALGDACKLLDFYDGYSGIGSEITEALTNRLNVEGIGNLSQICAGYGKEQLGGKDKLTAAVPTLIDKVKAMGDKPQLKWMEYLEETFPLDSKKGWEKADIWHSDENVFGMLASVFAWLSDHRLENLRESFGDYLNATKLGENARRSSDLNGFKKHCTKENATSPMHKWIFGLK